jgi:hypothetical protein
MLDASIEPRFYPHEVARGLHLKFDYQKRIVDGVEIIILHPDIPCRYFVDEKCMLYETEDMPLDCRIYPAAPTPDGDIVVDYEGCPMASFFDTPEYKRKVYELLKPHLPLDRRWLEAYWRLK